MKRLLTAVCIALVGIACDFAKPICGCTPVVHLAVVSGTVKDELGTPVANTPFMMVGMDAGRTFTPPTAPSDYFYKTDANGKFVAEIYGSGEVQEIRAAFYPAGRGVVVVNAGTAMFHRGGLLTDTVKVLITLPP